LSSGVSETSENAILLTASAEALPGDRLEAGDEIGYGTWLSRNLMLVVVRTPDEHASLEGAVRDGGRDTALDIRYMTCNGAGSSAEGPAWIVSTICVRSDSQVDRKPALFVMKVDGGSSLRLPVTDLKTTLRKSLAPLGASERERVLKFLASAPAEHRLEGLDFALNKSLFMVRQALRERLPSVGVTKEEPQAAQVDCLVRAESTGFYMQGWVRDAEAPVNRLTVVSPEGERAELLESLFHYARPDVEHLFGDVGYAQNDTQPGFIVYFELSTPSHLRDGWVLEVENAAGTRFETGAPSALDDPIAARTEILSGLPLDALPSETLMSQHVHPAIMRLGKRQRELSSVKDVVEYGRPSRSPEVSLIIPLYERVDFLEHQLAQFVHDPELEAADLVYVLDSPQLETMLRDYAAQLFELYHVPFRLVVLERSSGFAAANSAGIGESLGSLLLLLNSDVLPDRPGWLSRMIAFHRGRENIGALGVKLLYPDNSLQHAGMFFDLPTGTASPGHWRNMHYFKGFQRDLPAANVVRSVPAVTGACMMIAKDVYERVGGFPDVYVQGGFEDSELCLRLIGEGRENWYLPEVELYHLEGQSYPSSTRAAATRYNRWLHTRRMDELIKATMARYPSSIDTTVG
jgi:O-antigen biosynthesis protein